MNAKLKGRWGEAQAAGFLRENGYHIVAANYRSRFGEIDLIAENRGFVIFAEVKLRLSHGFSLGREAVDRRKAERLRTTAELWLAENDTELQPRFDVIEIYAPNGMNTAGMKITHLENAF